MERLRDQVLIASLLMLLFVAIMLIVSPVIFVAQLMLGAGISVLLIVPACILTGILATVIIVALVVLFDHIDRQRL